MNDKARPRIVIVGGGFGGLKAAEALARLPVDITLVDRKNHHTFQPLLYQVATAGLSPAEIAAPIRGILARHKNIEVLLGEVSDFDLDKREVRVTGDALAEDLVEPFQIDDYTRWRLMEGLDDIGLTLRHEDAIGAFEASRPGWLPVTL